MEKELRAVVIGQKREKKKNSRSTQKRDLRGSRPSILLETKREEKGSPPLSIKKRKRKKRGHLSAWEERRLDQDPVLSLTANGEGGRE